MDHVTGDQTPTPLLLAVGLVALAFAVVVYVVGYFREKNRRG